MRRAHHVAASIDQGFSKSGISSTPSQLKETIPPSLSSLSAVLFVSQFKLIGHGFQKPIEMALRVDDRNIGCVTVLLLSC